MFPLLIRNLRHLLGLPVGADEPVTSLAIDEQWAVHIGCEDDMVTVLLPLGPAPDPLPGAALVNSLAQWPPVLLDLSEQGEAILWAREHVGRLTAEQLHALLVRVEGGVCVPREHETT
ncbi:type III secretion system chaperone, partial [Bordetella pertussis]|uniref:type III secretion system chaperone n=1 Tax=Bordetella pertussis TaxID=520 RepID=UPI00366CDA23